MKSSVSDLILALAQVFLACVMALGFLGAFFALAFLRHSFDQTTNALLTGLVGVLGTIVTQQNGYFFQRQRPHTLPDPKDAPPGPGILNGTFQPTPGAPTHVQPAALSIPQPAAAPQTTSAASPPSAPGIGAPRPTV